ncbi:hypothetical protein BB558_001573 [Smittium angustum]|uniref:Kinesin motor domain-containing protein n=1 Tax=Smittium angustum TaxID=133377 RepID=A0A2U1JB13_SMIAN|nr:hypothetical protein BB558_001573 [Smittium angustum]
MENVNVYIRIRPFLETDFVLSNKTPVISHVSENTIALRSLPRDFFTFDYIAGMDSTQEDIFNKIGKNTVSRSLQGYNGTIFAYGQTGSGKTYTMLGNNDYKMHPEGNQRGLIPRCFEYQIKRSRRNSVAPIKYLCKASYIEIYNEVIYDLLDQNIKPCALREDIKKGVFIEGVTEENVDNVEQALMLLKKGSDNRRVGETAMNRESSRSHTVFTLYIQSMSGIEGGLMEIKESKFNLVDLAGSERQKMAQTIGVRLKEAASINKSLSVLGNVINSLADNNAGKNRHINYRDSKLTFLLRDSLGGNSITTMITNISPSLFSESETLSSLRFAKRAKLIKNKVMVNQNTKGDVSALQMEINKLTAEINFLRKTDKKTTSSIKSEITVVPDEDYKKQVKLSDWLAYLALRKLEEEKRQKDSLTKSLLQMHLKTKKQYQTIQQLKLIVRLRKSENFILRKKSDASEICKAENSSLRSEVRHLSQKLASSRDIDDLILENTQLKEYIKRIESIKSSEPENNVKLPKVDELASQISRIVTLNFSEMLDSVPLQNDISEITMLENNLKAAQDDIIELEQQRDYLEFKVSGIEEDWRIVNETLENIVFLDKENKKAAIEKAVNEVVWDEPRKLYLLYKNLMSTQQNQPKPSLNGVKIKTRKRVNKANAKFEPEVFRDSLFELIANVPEADLDKYSNIIDTAGNTLDYRRYGETFFELLVSGGLIAPGGIIEYDEEYGEIPFCLFKLSNAEDPLPGARDWVNLVTKLTRRYKYLEKIFSETSKGIIEYVNRYSEENNKKLAAGFGLLIAEGFIYPDVIKVLQKDHLVKDGYALHVLTMLMKAYLTKRSVLNLFTALHKFKADDLIEFFPLNKRSDEYFIRHFESEDMHQIIKYKLAIQANDAREIILQEVVDLMNESEGKAPISEIIKIGRKTMAQNQLTENEVVVLLWDAVMGNVRWGMRSEVIEQQALAEVKEYADAFAPFTSSPKSEMALLKHIQIYCYEDAKLMRLFYQIVRILYTEDVLSHDAIIFWYSKGALPQGKSTFMKQMERFVVHLQSLDSESEDEDDEE